MRHLLFTILLTVFANWANAQAWHQQGLIHYYTFDSLPGFDSAQQKVNLSWTGGANAKTNNRHQESNKALELANTSSSLQANLADLPHGKDFRTFAVWIYVPLQFQQEYEFAFFQGILDTGKGFGLGFFFQGQSFASGYLDDLNFPNTFPIGQWTHYALRFHQDTLSLFLNGELKQAARKENWSTSGTILTIGALRESGGGANSGGSIFNPFSGKLDDFRIYNRALSEYEILKLASDDFSEIATSIAATPKHHVLIFPQPATTTLSIQYDQMPESIAIYAINGSFVKTIRPVEAHEVQIKGLAGGLYSAVITWPDGTQLRKKLVLSHTE